MRGRPASSTTCSRTCANRGRTGTKYTGERLKDNYYRVSVLKQKLIEERGEKCEDCGYSKYPIHQVHHIIEQSQGGTDELSNLKLLCPNCHYTAHYLGRSIRLATEPLLKSVEV
mgnify:FL=1